MTRTRPSGPRPASGSAARVVVVGAGFGGLAAVRALARAGMRVTLIDRNIYATFQPLLYQVATGGLTSSDVAYPARAPPPGRRTRRRPPPPAPRRYRPGPVQVAWS